jgi:putative lipoic acid-binding regulatory protein
MNANLPPLDLLNQTHQFPCSYVFKAIGHVESGFAARVVAEVREELSQDTDPPHRFRQSASGRHVSVTLEPRVETAEQVLAVYRRIASMTGLIVLL